MVASLLVLVPAGCHAFHLSAMVDGACRLSCTVSTFYCTSDVVSSSVDGARSQSIYLTMTQKSKNGGPCFTRSAETNEAAQYKIVDEKGKCTGFVKVIMYRFCKCYHVQFIHGYEHVFFLNLYLNHWQDSRF